MWVRIDVEYLVDADPNISDADVLRAEIERWDDEPGRYLHELLDPLELGDGDVEIAIEGGFLDKASAR